MMATDKILLEVLRVRMKSIAEEMAAATLRTGFTVFVKETSDFGACLVAPDGEVVAAPTETAISLMVGIPGWEDIHALGEYEEGDIGIVNDPDATKGMGTHLPDIWTWKPIFADGEIIAFAFNFIHSSDVGGKVAGSISPTNFDIFQEGLRIPPMKLYRAGVLNQELIDMILLNCRIPEQNWGDIKAQVASLNLAERRVLELVDRYGRETIKTAIVDLRDTAEEAARELIREIPDGDYEFVDYLEGDVAGLEDIRIKLTLRINGGDMLLDFTGTDYQVQAAFNVPTWNQRGHYMIAFPILNLFRTFKPDIPYNSGLVRPLGLHAPRGSLVNPESGAAIGVRSATMFRVLDNLTGCLTQALPTIMPAASAGATAIVVVSTLDPRTGEQKIEVAQPLTGGSGGRPRQEGIDGTSFTGGWLRNVPNEVLEADVPVLVEEYGYREGSGGAGERRGGNGIRFRIRTMAPETLMSARGLERFRFAPWGLAGGSPGRSSQVTLNPGTADEQSLGKFDLLRLKANDVVQFETPGGGGFGEPLDRDPSLVHRDVASGLLDADDARRRYGVVVDDDGVNEEATRAARAELPRSAYPVIDLGEVRRAYDCVWTDDIVTEMQRLLAEYPTRLRPVLYDRLRDVIKARPEPTAVSEIADLLTRVREDAGVPDPAVLAGARRE